MCSLKKKSWLLQGYLLRRAAFIGVWGWGKRRNLPCNLKGGLRYAVPTVIYFCVLGRYMVTNYSVKRFIPCVNVFCKKCLNVVNYFFGPKVCWFVALVKHHSTFIHHEWILVIVHIFTGIVVHSKESFYTFCPPRICSLNSCWHIFFEEKQAEIQDLWKVHKTQIRVIKSF